MPRSRIVRFTLLTSAALLCLSLVSCSPFYVMRAAYEEGKILSRREKITDLIDDPTTPPEEKKKLQLVLDAREFAIKMGLTPKDSFTRYTRMDKKVLTWVLVASKPTAFDLHTWWFPIVGSVPYKGYFDREDATKAAERLKGKGYETWVRGSQAFSTLGWFNDPVLSTTLDNPDTWIVNTVIHETTHATVWSNDHIDFNESLANFVGVQGAIEFFQEKVAQCGNDAACRKENEELLRKAEATKVQEFYLGKVVDRLYRRLNELYRSSASDGEKLEQREKIFAEEVKPLHEKYPGLDVLREINNAEIIQLRLYLTSLVVFDDIYRKRGAQWAAFLKEMKTQAQALGTNESTSAFRLNP